MRIIKTICMLSALIILAVTTSCSSKITERSGFALNTIVNIKIYGGGSDAEKCMDELFERLNEIELIASAKDPQSELYKLNEKAADIPTAVSDTLFFLIERGIYYSSLTDGAFDITLGKISDLWGIGTENARVPDKSELCVLAPNIGFENVTLDREKKLVYYNNKEIKIDLGGIAKGYAADETARIIKEYGIENALVYLGGNIIVVGDKYGKGWKIGVPDPRSPSETLTNITVENMSVVTAGGYERYFVQGGVRYHHIFDRKTGYPSDSGTASVTVIAADSLEADALSTALFVMTRERAEVFIEEHNIRAILIDEDGGVFGC